MLADEVKGEEEFNEELRKKKGNVEDAPFEEKMNFGSEESTTDLGFQGFGAD